MLPALVSLIVVSASEGPALFYWGSRAPVIVAEDLAKKGAETLAGPVAEAHVSEVHAAFDKTDLVLRFTFDRPVREAIYLPDGTPVSGRLRAVLYLDADDDRTTGLDGGSADLRTGADRRLEIGALSVGTDAEEKRKASAVVTATLHALFRDGRRRFLWRRDDAASPREVSAHGEFVEVRVPAGRADLGPRARLILVEGDRSWDARFRP